MYLRGTRLFLLFASETVDLGQENLGEMQKGLRSAADFPNDSSPGVFFKLPLRLEANNLRVYAAPS